MNRVYKIVWSKAKNAYVVTSILSLLLFYKVTGRRDVSV